MSIDVSQLRRLDARSVQVNPPADGSLSNYFVLTVAGIADGFVPWGTSPVTRDRQLREFWPTEPWLAGTVASLSARNAAFSWTLEGPPRTADRIQTMLHASNYGAGWTDLILRLSNDLYTCDNGAFLEIIRDGDSPSAAAIGLANLDSSRCQRTGNWETPVIYTDRDGQRHKLQWFQVLDFTDSPSTLETMNGLGFCATSRVLRYAQIMRDTAVYQHEKVSGRNPGALHIVSGVSTQAIKDVLAQAAEHADNKLQARYEVPAVMGTLDPAAEVRLVSILLKSLPENYDAENDRKWYIAALALAFGAEYQDLAPLPGGGLGTSAQSQTLHLKAKGKGPELFQKLLTHKLNFYVLPQNVQFKFDEKDYEALSVEATVRKTRAETRAARITSGEITPQVARQIANDEGDLKNEYLQLMASEDVTPEGQVSDEEIEQEPAVVQPGQPAAATVPPVPPAAAGPATSAPPTQPPTLPVATKHLAGAHNQSAHGWRYGGGRAAVQQMMGRLSPEDRQVFSRRLRTRQDIERAQGPKKPTMLERRTAEHHVAVSMANFQKRMVQREEQALVDLQSQYDKLTPSARKRGEGAHKKRVAEQQQRIRFVRDDLQRENEKLQAARSALARARQTAPKKETDESALDIDDVLTLTDVEALEILSMVMDDDDIDPEQDDSATKEFDADAWDRRRLRREKEYEDELTAILEEVQARVIASVKREVAASGA